MGGVYWKISASLEFQSSRRARCSPSSPSESEETYRQNKLVDGKLKMNQTLNQKDRLFFGPNVFLLFVANIEQYATGKRAKRH